MRYSNIDFTVRYVDPSKSSSGTGETPATALNNLPANASGIAENTCYLIRRTAEASACTLPNGTNSSVKNCLIIGMPIAADQMWDLVPAEARTAWGSDVAAYAQIQTTNASGSLQLPSVQQFVLHRVYLSRNGVDANAYLLKFNNSSSGIGCYSFDHCKFGAKGIDVDLSTYKTEVTTSKFCGYVYIYYARMVSVTNSLLNHGLCAYSSYGHGIYCRWADVMNVENVQIFSPATISSSQSYPLMLADSYAEGVECNIRNVTQTIRLNGTSGQYVPQLLSVQGYAALNASGICVKTGDALSDARPSNYQVYYATVNFQNVYELNIDGVDLEYKDCWSCRAPALQCTRCYGSTYVPGISKGVKNVKVTFASTDGIGSSLSYDNAASSGGTYAAINLEFASNDGSVYVKVPVVDGITVVNPRGKAFSGENIRLTNAEFEGCVTLKASVADIKSVKTWFPGKAVSAYSGTHMRVRKLECNIENDVYVFNEDPAVGSTIESEGNVFVDESNTSLRPMTSLSSQADHICQGIGCNNEGAEGHFAYRCENGICDTWSVYRQGGGASALKISNNSCTSGKTMVWGRRPFNGMQLLPTTRGRHLLKAHIAFKGYAKPAELYRHFFLSAQVGEKTFYSTLHGRWVDDSSAVWVNDSDLTQMLLELPIDILEVSPVDVRVYFSWYSSGGFVYLDPDIELVEA